MTPAHDLARARRRMEDQLPAGWTIVHIATAIGAELLEPPLGLPLAVLQTRDGAGVMVLLPDAWTPLQDALVPLTGTEHGVRRLALLVCRGAPLPRLLALLRLGGAHRVLALLGRLDYGCRPGLQAQDPVDETDHGP